MLGLAGRGSRCGARSHDPSIHCQAVGSGRMTKKNGPRGEAELSAMFSWVRYDSECEFFLFGCVIFRVVGSGALGRSDAAIHDSRVSYRVSHVTIFSDLINLVGLPQEPPATVAGDSHTINPVADTNIWAPWWEIARSSAPIIYASPEGSDEHPKGAVLHRHQLGA